MGEGTNTSSWRGSYTWVWRPLGDMRPGLVSQAPAQDFSCTRGPSPWAALTLPFPACVAPECDKGEGVCFEGGA